MTGYNCTWCNKEVNEQDFDTHSRDHYRKQAELMKSNPSTTMTSISSVSYIKEGLA
jgi:hypothetical protein